MTGPISCEKQNGPDNRRGPFGTVLRRMSSGRTPYAARQIGKSPRTLRLNCLLSKSSCLAPASRQTVVRRRSRGLPDRKRERGALSNAPSFVSFTSGSGGGENRTPVLRRISRSAYVRSPSIDVSVRWPTGRPRTDEPSRVSRFGRRRTATLSQICDTPWAAPGGLPVEHCWCSSALAGVTQPGRSFGSQLKVSRVFYQEPEDLGTQPRGHLHNRNRSPPVQSI